MLPGAVSFFCSQSCSRPPLWDSRCNGAVSGGRRVAGDALGVPGVHSLPDPLNHKVQGVLERVSPPPGPWDSGEAGVPRSSARTRGWGGRPSARLTRVSPQMYIALASVHALVLCGLQFISCVRGQWTGKRQADGGAEGAGGCSLLLQELSDVFNKRMWVTCHTAVTLGQWHPVCTVGLP